MAARTHCVEKRRQRCCLHVLGLQSSSILTMAHVSVEFICETPCAMHHSLDELSEPDGNEIPRIDASRRTETASFPRFDRRPSVRPPRFCSAGEPHNEIRGWRGTAVT